MTTRHRYKRQRPLDHTDRKLFYGGYVRYALFHGFQKQRQAIHGNFRPEIAQGGRPWSALSYSSRPQPSRGMFRGWVSMKRNLGTWNESGARLRRKEEADAEERPPCLRISFPEHRKAIMTT